MGSPQEKAPHESTADSAALVADVQVDTQVDSEFSDYSTDVDSYTTSLASSIAEFKFENGRRYHSYKEGSYIWPNDDKENDRLDMMHQLMLVARHGKLLYTPVNNPKRILDIGTGTGIWAMEIADQFPNAEVIGNDLSPIQPRWVPPNLSFEVDDIENSIRNWPKLVSQIYKNLAPGGYAEFVDFDGRWTSPDGSLKDDSVINYVVNNFLDLCNQDGTEPSPGPKIEGWCKDEGFEIVKTERIPIPCGTWPADKWLKEIGAWQYLQVSEGLEGLLMAVFTRSFGLSSDEVIALSAKMKAELKDPKIHPMIHMHVISARKPEKSVDDNEEAK